MAKENRREVQAYVVFALPVFRNRLAGLFIRPVADTHITSIFCQLMHTHTELGNDKLWVASLMIDIVSILKWRNWPLYHKRYLFKYSLTTLGMVSLSSSFKL